MLMAARAVASRTPAARSAAARFVQTRPWSSGRKVPGEVGKAAKNFYMKKEYEDRALRLEKFCEAHDLRMAEHEKGLNDLRALLQKTRDKCDKQVKATLYAVNGVSVFLVLRHMF